MQRTAPTPAPDYMVIGNEERALSGDDSVLQPDGKLVVLTTISTGTNTSTLAFIRYNTDGTRDKAFGDAGMREVEVGYSAKANNVELMPDGRIVGFGGSRTSSGFLGKFGAAAVRLNANGSVDTSFGSNGIAFASYSGSHAFVARGTIAADGSVYIAGSQGSKSYPTWTVTHFLPHGQLDPLFGTGGHATSTLHGSAFDVSVLGDGKLIVAGCQSNEDWCDETVSKVVVARFHPLGALDTTFGAAGVHIASPAGFSDLFADEVAVLADSTMVVSVSGTKAGASCGGLLKLRANGALETTFGAAGWISACSSPNNSSSLMTRADGSILLVGTAGPSTGLYDTIGNITYAGIAATDKLSLLQVSAAGVPDPTYGGAARAVDGLIVHGFGDSGGAPRSAQVLPDGRLLVVGSALVGGTRHLALARFNADGTPDTTYGSGARNTEVQGGGPEGGCIADGMKTLGSARVYGCLEDKGTKWVATGALDVHGVKLVPDAGSAIEFNKKTLTLSTTKGVEIYLGDINVAHMKIKSWQYTVKLPEQCWTVKKGATFKGLPVQGEACVKLLPDGTATAQAWALVPKLSKLSNVTASMTMSLALGEGLKIDTIKASMKAADLPSVGRFTDLSLTYNLEIKGNEVTHTWKGGANLMMPEPLGGAGGVTATVVNSELKEIGASARVDVNRPIGTTGVFMNWVQINLNIGEGIAIGGSVGMSFGPEIEGVALAKGELSILFETKGRCKAYAGSDRAPTITLKGTAELMQIMKLDGEVCGMSLGFATVDGTATLGRTIKLKAWKLEVKLQADVVGRTEGWLETKGNFSIAGDTEATLAARSGPFDKDWTVKGVETLMTNRGATACWWKEPKKFGVRFFGSVTIPNGLYVKWRGAKLHTGCGLKKIKVKQSIDPVTPAPVPAARSKASALNVGGATFASPGGGSDIAIQLEGEGAAPDITLTAPGGQQYSSDGALGDETSGVTFATIEGQTSLDVVVPNAKKGTWKVATNVGSAPVTLLEAGIPIAPPSITAKVKRGKNGRYALSWKAKGLSAGTSIRFVDRVGGVTRTITSTKRASGTKSFTTVAGTSARHDVFAVVTTASGPLARPKVTSFKAVKLAKPGAVAKVKVTRKKMNVTIAWKAGKGGKVKSWKYVARYSSGRTVAGTVKGPKLVLTGVRGRDKVKVTLIGLNVAGMAGPPKILKIG